jgi:hypothetical protein
MGPSRRLVLGGENLGNTPYRFRLIQLPHREHHTAGSEYE